MLASPLRPRPAMCQEPMRPHGSQERRGVTAGSQGSPSGQPADFRLGASLFPRDQGGARGLSPWKRGG